ncbi:hypothetical protein TUZN_0014 [Thermoproteus uzoniensis 768-20]|uniref:Uncharacterized protein n=1 Tax=Thermoproteus uzoniensis (strain 768-20) TaxID=999630 RepID=F2L0P1_THEU7|nr:hypothetical protein TUZN_0014 [Thermoproteus uzoniensis 768-20]
MFRPIAVVGEVFRVRLNDKALLYVNHGPRRGTHMLIKALAIVKRVYGEDITLLVAGRFGP